MCAAKTYLWQSMNVGVSNGPSRLVKHCKFGSRPEKQKTQKNAHISMPMNIFQYFYIYIHKINIHVHKFTATCIMYIYICMRVAMMNQMQKETPAITSRTL